jgi:hypothetical protein
VVKLRKLRAAATSGSSSQPGYKGLGNGMELRKSFAYWWEGKTKTISNTSYGS